MISILTDMNFLLSTQPQFSLDNWVSSAESCASNAEEAKLFVENSLNQITLWGPDANILDYATKQWAGVVSR
jgi:alpha-N-acetylglucosaminidase